MVLVDYGSVPEFAEPLQKICKAYSFVTLITCPVSGQLWNKCRAINIALKPCETPYFLVGDIDLIFHPHFVQKALLLADENKVTYFKYAFLSKQESLKKQDFETFEVDFFGGEEVTGTTLFPTEILKSVNGYDEFYHGWGAEDTDIHIRLKNKGLPIYYHESETLLKHQWHPKAYRSKLSTHPFHSKLERINHAYMIHSEKNKLSKVNLSEDWGLIPNNNKYDTLSKPEDYLLKFNNNQVQISALFAHLKNLKNQTVLIHIVPVDSKIKYKEFLKKCLGKKSERFLAMETINNTLLEELIKNYRNLPYSYTFSRETLEINLNMVF